MHCICIFSLLSSNKKNNIVSDSLVIIPTYNEKENIAKMIRKIFSLTKDFNLLIVEDNSPDGTGAIVKSLMPEYEGRLFILERKGKLGLGTAYIEGFKLALERNYQYIFEMDCDFSHDPNEIPVFLKAAEQADLVIGSRYSGGVRVLNWPLKRLLLSRSAGVFVQCVTGMPFTDPTGGYKCFRRRALEAIGLSDVRSNGYSFQIELTHRLWRQGYTIVESPITFADRTEGTSKMSGHIVGEAFWMVWRLWLQNGLRRSPRQKK